MGISKSSTNLFRIWRILKQFLRIPKESLRNPSISIEFPTGIFNYLAAGSTPPEPGLQQNVIVSSQIAPEITYEHRDLSRIILSRSNVSGWQFFGP